ncbi:cytidylyltransferase domain-containing protein [Cohnella lupini]|uniref:Spore coat polysaccharide biosynthesis protein SpsF n=1 Tax=Cohnella lupini TaxID=1294267 RepID=A0A3D9ITS8_9BACL|nr:glycosyltransferase family protein [Cohnella lupini]RED65057.1 spore coat polysaccharide biosynthesis protein SpsF [Cohnella lupini]
MKVVAIVQARMGSSRLPGKVLRLLNGNTVLELIHERLSQCRTLDEIIIATSLSNNDDAIAEAMERLKIPVYRGDEHDVLDRYYRVASLTMADVVVRITGDCPLIDPEIVDAVVDEFVERYPSIRYASNIHPPTFPDGLDVEVFSYDALERAWKESDSRFEREHVTPFIRGRPHSFPQANIESTRDYSGLRWTLDEERDYAFLSALVAKAVEHGIDPMMASFEHWLDILERNPDLPEIIRDIERNEGSKIVAGVEVEGGREP